MSLQGFDEESPRKRGRIGNRHNAQHRLGIMRDPPADAERMGAKRLYFDGGWPPFADGLNLRIHLHEPRLWSHHYPRPLADLSGGEDLHIDDVVVDDNW